ncbi:hypothetical protein ACWPKO_19635 (plasmid) [Coraliomargarita sp. W4R53]
MNLQHLENQLDKAITACPKCAHMSPEAVARHRAEALRTIERNATRIPATLPAHVWPNGQALN